MQIFGCAPVSGTTRVRRRRRLKQDKRSPPPPPPRRRGKFVGPPKLALPGKYAGSPQEWRAWFDAVRVALKYKATAEADLELSRSRLRKRTTFSA